MPYKIERDPKTGRYKRGEFIPTTYELSVKCMNCMFKSIVKINEDCDVTPKSTSYHFVDNGSGQYEGHPTGIAILIQHKRGEEIPWTKRTNESYAGFFPRFFGGNPESYDSCPDLAKCKVIYCPKCRSMELKKGG